MAPIDCIRGFVTVQLFIVLIPQLVSISFLIAFLLDTERMANEVIAQRTRRLFAFELFFTALVAFAFARRLYFPQNRGPFVACCPVPSNVKNQAPSKRERFEPVFSVAILTLRSATGLVEVLLSVETAFETEDTFIQAEFWITVVVSVLAFVGSIFAMISCCCPPPLKTQLMPSDAKISDAVSSAVRGGIPYVPLVPFKQ